MSKATMHASRVLETCLYVDNLQAAKEFYTRVLGLELFSEAVGRHVFFRHGTGVFLLFDSRATRRPGGMVPAHGAEGAGHVALAMRDDEAAAWRDHLEQQGVPIEAKVTWPGGGHSLYFRDPAGNSLELTTPRTWGLPED